MPFRIRDIDVFFLVAVEERRKDYDKDCNAV